jgi:Family of unknown function (DUF5947)
MTSATNTTALATLQRFVRKPRARVEICELCAKPLAPQHHHLLELDQRRVTCSCDACAILFSGNSRQHYKRIPRDVVRLNDFAMDSQEWESLLIPINLAYFVYNSEAGRVVAQYPSPGGAMESSLDLEYWNAIVARNPVLKKFEPDVEALLVNRIGVGSPSPGDIPRDGTPHAPRYYRAPIDQCFRLVGIIRTHWRGLSGGGEVWQEIDKFFAQLDRFSEGELA